MDNPASDRRQVADIVGNGEMHGDGPQHRRERELSSLFATARELTVLGDVDSVLSSIVRHAHGLIGTDITYLSVFDDAGIGLTLRAVEGSLSPAFRSAHVPADTGVGGRIVETQAPHWVANYLADRSLTHDAGFDRILEAEGIVALLGVPLRDGSRVFGVLYAADRTERPFDMDEVALLSAFADHAAVALRNARLYEQSTRSLAELQTAYAAIEKFETMHDALTSVVLSGGGAAEIAHLLADALGGRVAVHDRDGHVVVDTDGVDTGTHRDAQERADALTQSRRSGRCVTVATADGVSHSVVAIVAGDVYLGAVSHTDDRPLTPVEQRSVERAAQITALMILRQDAVIEAEERVRGELLTDVITSPRPWSAELLLRARSRQLDVQRSDTLVVIESERMPPATLVRRLNLLPGEWHALVGLHLGSATMLFDADGLEDPAAEIHRRLRDSLRTPLLVCATPVRPGRDSLQRPFATATRCLRLLRSMGVVDRAVSTTTLGLYAMVFDPDRGDDLRAFLGETIGPLLEYDARRNTDLVPTLVSYFENSGNLTRTADALHVHLNTLVKRLSRIGAVIGVDWQQPQRALPLHLAVRLHTVEMEAAAGDDG